MGCRFDEVRDVATPLTVDLGYVVPDVTIASLETARELGIRGEEDLFGGVVPFRFVAEKTITHPLIEPAAAAPQGWQSAFPERVRDVALPGWSAFSVGDARAAGLRLLHGGDVRLKPASGVGGSGQSVARGEAELDAQLAAIDTAEFTTGVVIERNPRRRAHLSVPCSSILLASYIGTQRTTRSRHGKEVYGGPRSRWRAATSTPSTSWRCKTARDARSQGRAYHEAALECFTGMFASRCNYDVAEGCDATGRQCVGVLEQSWRLGGAAAPRWQRSRR